LAVAAGTVVLTGEAPSFLAMLKPEDAPPAFAGEQADGLALALNGPQFHVDGPHRIAEITLRSNGR